MIDSLSIVLFNLLVYWSLALCAVILFATLISWILRDKPGNCRAALWSTILCVAWLLPWAPELMPDIVRTADQRANVSKVVVDQLPQRQHGNQPRAAAQHARVSSETPQVSETPHVLARSSMPRSSMPRRETRRTPIISSANANQNILWKQYFIQSILVVWIAGFLVNVYRWIRLRRSIRGIVKRAEEISQTEVNAQVERTRQILFIDAPISVKTADVRMAPFVQRFLRPLIFLPTYLMKEWGHREQLAVIAHELAHVRRYDLPLHHAMQWLRFVFWFLPPVWWMQRQLHETQDAACDECATIVLGSNTEFGHALTQIAENCLVSNHAFPALGILHAKHSLIERLENIMRHPLNRLTRVPLRYKFSYLLLAFALILLCGQFNAKALSQELNISYLANYPDVFVSEFVYLEPYYVNVVQSRNEESYHFYSRQGEGWELQQTVNQTVQGRNRYFRSLANDKIALFLYQQENGNLRFTSVDPAQSKASSGTLATGTSPVKIHLYDDTIYFMTGQPNQIITPDGTSTYQGEVLHKVNLVDNSVQIHYFYFPVDMIIRDFALLSENSLIILHHDRSSFTSSVSHVELFENGKYEISEESWFSESTDEETGIRKTARYLTLAGRQALILREVSYVNPSDVLPWNEVLVTDWTDTDQPVVIQEITPPATESPDEENLFHLVADAREKDILLIHGEHRKWIIDHQDDFGVAKHAEVTSMIFIYHWDGSQYALASTVNADSQQVALGKNHFVVNTIGMQQTWDISDLSMPQPFPYPTDHTIAYGSIAAVGNHLYSVYQPDRESSTLQVLNVSIPSDIQAQEFDLTAPVRFLDAHDGLLALWGRGEVFLYGLQANGAIEAPIPFSPFPDGAASVPLHPLFWDQDLFITVHTVSSNSSSNDAIVSVYEKTPTSIGSLLSTFRVPVKGIQNYFYSSKYLLVASSERGLSSQTGRFEETYQLSLYSMQNPQQPEFVVNHSLPASEFGPTAVRQEESLFKYPYFLYTRTLRQMDGVLRQINLVNLENLISPRVIPTQIDDRGFMYTFNDLILQNNIDSLSFYKRTPDGVIDMETIRLPSRAHDIAFTNKFMFTSHGQYGIDIYQLRMDFTSVLDWQAHR